jgi:hypothetical protein
MEAHMTETIGISIAAAGLIMTILGILVGLAYRLGTLSSEVSENTSDIKELQGSYVLGHKDVLEKLDLVLCEVKKISERTAVLEERSKHGNE